MAEKADSKNPVRVGPNILAPVILALEASGNAASAAVLIDGKIAGMAEHKARHGHAETLISLAEEAISATDCPLSDITHIAAGCGPGSFTGLRVCLSAAKGYMLAIGARPIGVSGLAALAYQAHKEQSGTEKIAYLACADSRRSSVFAQFFDAECRAQGNIEDMKADQLKTACVNALKKGDIEKLILCGLAEAEAEADTEIARPADFAPLPESTKIEFDAHTLNAADIAHYAFAALGAPDIYPVSGFEPLYIAAPKLGGQRPPTV